MIIGSGRTLLFSHNVHDILRNMSTQGGLSLLYRQQKEDRGNRFLNTEQNKLYLQVLRYVVAEKQEKLPEGVPSIIF